jgi:uncharacterized membrane protein YbhN (UPF0104 family)
VSASEPSETSEAPEGHARRLRNGIITLGVLVVLVAALLIAVPGLHGVGRAVTRMTPGWIVAAVILELLSCAGYVLIFLRIFDRAPFVFGTRVALTEMAFGAAVSLGGAGSLAVGAWLLRERGMSLSEIAERSAVLFLLTSAINAITLIGAGVLLGLGIVPGPRNPLLSLLPAGLGIVVAGVFLALPWLTERGANARRAGRRTTVLRAVALTIRDTRTTLLRPDWRLLGAFAYLWCDIGVLWACFHATGHEPPIAVIVLAYQIGYLANVVPIPGNVGVLEGSFVGMFVLYGASATTAAAASVVYHAIALWIPLLWGTIAFIRLQRDRHEPLPERQSRAEREQSEASRQ